MVTGKARFLITLTTPYGPPVSLSGTDAADLAEVLVAAADRVPASPSRTVVLTASYHVVRTPAGWMATCAACEAADEAHGHFPPRTSYPDAEQDALAHLVDQHPDPQDDEDD